MNPVSPGLVSSRIELLDQPYGSVRRNLECMSQLDQIADVAILVLNLLMDRFGELIARCVNFMIRALNEASDANLGDGCDASTTFVKNAQAFQLGKVVLAVGIFSIFEARLQDSLNCSDGFTELRKILSNANKQNLALRFEQFAAAVNVLKHGRGRSYDWLLSRDVLPFVVKTRDQHFFFEGDVSEPDTLVLVDDEFVRSCGELVEASIEAVRSVKPSIYFG